jgi:hypothetical protein
MPDLRRLCRDSLRIARRSGRSTHYCGPSPNWQHRRVAKIAAVCAVLVLILLLRRPEMVTHPEFWGEDGRIFFVQADTEGARALVTPYRGYHHFLLRVVAAAAAG